MEIPRAVLGFLLCSFAAVSAACSSHDRPKEIGDCTGTANECLDRAVASGSGSSADGGGCGAFSFGNTTCQSCVETSCCSIVGLCSNNQDCVALVACLGGCTTQTCDDNCRSSLPNGVADHDAVDECVISSCSDACGLGDAGTSPIQADASSGLGQSCGRLSYQSVSCQTCVEGGCCDQAEMCASDPDCYLYIQCLATCTSTDTKCKTDCQTTAPVGFTNSSNLNLCIQEKCSAPCQ